MGKRCDTRDAVAQADEQVNKAVRARIAAGHEHALRSLGKLVRWVPEYGFPATCKPVYDDPPRDDCPFFTEGYLYELLGKGDARSILSYLNALAESLGTSVFELQCAEESDDGQG